MVLEDTEDVVDGDASIDGYLGDINLFISVLRDVLKHLTSPVARVADQPQIGQRLLRRALLPLLPAQQITEIDQELAVAFPLLVRQRHDAGEIVVGRRMLLLGKVSDD